MSLTVKLFKQVFLSLVLVIPMTFGFISWPLPSIASELEFPSSVVELSKNFSNNFCSEISGGLSVEVAAKVTVRKIIRSLILSDSFKEILSVSKEDLSAYLAAEIFDRCEKDIIISEKELTNYFFDLSNRGEEMKKPKPFKPFGVG